MFALRFVVLLVLLLFYNRWVKHRTILLQEMHTVMFPSISLWQRGQFQPTEVIMVPNGKTCFNTDLVTEDALGLRVEHM